MRWLGLCFLLLGLSCATSSGEQRSSTPNIVVIQVDDLGYNDLGVHGNTIVETPNLDRMALQSRQFSQFYVNPVCAATRASFLTGRQFLKTGVSHVHGGKDYLHRNEVTIANVLSDAGYATGTWGKWHVGKTHGYLPRDRGFQEAYVADLYRHRNSSGSWNGQRVQHKQWADEVIVDYAIDFMERNEHRPFFAYLSSMTCHGRLDAEEAMIAKYQEKGLEKGLATLYAMVEMLDQEVGRLLRYLEDSGKAERTVVFFLSDNGPAVNRHELSDNDRSTRKVNPFKGFKGNIWENGVRSPLFVRWPGRIGPGSHESLTDITDLFPTIAELAGATYDHQVDGIDLLSSGGDTPQKYSFNYANPAWPPTDQPWTPEGILDEYRPVVATDLLYDEQIISVRHGDFKLLMNAAENMNDVAKDRQWTLFNISKDPYEVENLSGRGLEQESHLKEVLQNWFQKEIQQGDHAFAMPRHFVEEDTTIIYAVAATSISSSITPTFNWLANWQSEASATYEVDWKAAASYRLDLYHDQVDEVPFEVTVGSTSVPFVLEGTKSSVTLQDIPLGVGPLTLRKMEDADAIQRIDRLELIRFDTQD